MPPGTILSAGSIMPEGPSIIILKERVQQFKNKRTTSVTGNSKKINMGSLEHQIVRDFKSWGKHFLICFDHVTIRVHFLLFGSYLIDERKAAEPRLSLQFTDGEINFYACSVLEITEPLDQVYDWSADVMNDHWDAHKALLKLHAENQAMVCDALLDQHLFAGVGNIIKNEVLYRIRIHPESTVGKIPEKKQKEMIKEAVKYSFEFLEWKKEFTLRQHWLAHTKTRCTRCNLPIYKKYTGNAKRRSFFCTNCQELYT